MNNEIYIMTKPENGIFGSHSKHIEKIVMNFHVNTDVVAWVFIN